ncbi:hypothetical protein G6038_23900 [Rhodococcus sp. 14C212]|uniref:hypothetical protein n=1 Tax=Rhodococcus sp. 14C212 TaxID=2711209 RepID=UPI0013EC1CD9|nr:hypothetical protein [Rhodococcus sp. 14C212]NGP08465.1 hypothetical protein [Rhodococcus sp. 14C212]
MTGRTRKPENCLWCGRPVADAPLGRRRRYCRRSCRQRAYEHRTLAREAGLPEDAVVLTADEATAVADRAFEVRCAAEDVATAVGEGAGPEELAPLCADLVRLARAAERLR